MDLKYTADLEIWGTIPYLEFNDVLCMLARLAHQTKGTLWDGSSWFNEAIKELGKLKAIYVKDNQVIDKD